MSAWFEWRDAPKAEFAVLGDPIHHSKSPAMHSASFATLGLAFRYVAIRVPVEELAGAVAHLRSLGYRGLNITIPLKEAAATLCASLDSLAARIGAVNTLDLDSMGGRNTDGPGFLAGLEAAGKPTPSRALILGAGGSARAVVAMLADRGVDLSIWNRTPARARTLLAELGVQAEVVETPATDGYDLLVNCTSGLAPVDLGLDWSAASPDALAYDLMVASEPTPFLAGAAAAGLKTQDGAPMLVRQGALSMRGWTGIEPDENAMLKAVLGTA